MAALRKYSHCQALKSEDVLEMSFLCSSNLVRLRRVSPNMATYHVCAALTQFVLRTEDARQARNYSILDSEQLLTRGTQPSSLHTFLVLLQGKNESVLPLQTGILLKRPCIYLHKVLGSYVHNTSGLQPKEAQRSFGHPVPESACSSLSKK